MRASLLPLVCALLVANDVGASSTAPRVPGSIAFWNSHDGIAAFGECRSSVCLGRIATTSNGGRSWHTRRRDRRLGTGVVSTRGGSKETWVLSAHGLLHSTNRGRTWGVIPGTADVTDFSFPTNEVGYALGGEQFSLRFIRTVDGGRSWKRSRLPCGRVLAQEAHFSFPTAHHGWLLCAGQPSAGFQAKALYETTDGAKHWRRLPRHRAPYSSGYARGLSMLSDGSGLLWLARGSTYYTSDGGRNWRPVSITSPEVREASSGWVVSPRVSYLLVWDNGSRYDVELMRSNDGAHTWHRVRSWSRS